MQNKTSIHIKSCNIGQSEAHNRRSEEYLARINEKNIYIRRDLIPLNESWVSGQMQGCDLQHYYDDIARMVKEKTGRALQTKERKVVNKKTGRVKTVSGSAPIREGVLVCQDSTTMEQLQHFCQLCQERFGITAIQIHTHRDEGHYENPHDKTTWKPNYHAHIIWDWMSHETGKSYKLSAEDMSEMQDMAAGVLGMERGTSKAETNREHLERNDFIVAKQKAEAKEAKHKAETLQRENEAKEQIAANLDKEIAMKANKANRENGNKILQGGAAIANAIANKAGMGKYAAIEKENEELKASVPKRLAELQRQYEATVAAEVERQTAQLRSENVQLKEECASAIDRYNRLASSYDEISFDKKRAETALVEYKRGEQERFNAFVAETKWKDDVLAVIALMLAKTDQLLRQAIDAIIRFAKSKCSSFFFDEEAFAIKATMTNYARTSAEHQSIGKWLSRAAKADGHLTVREVARAEKEVVDVAQGRYDRRLGISGGMKL